MFKLFVVVDVISVSVLTGNWSWPYIVDEYWHTCSKLQLDVYL